MREKSALLLAAQGGRSKCLLGQGCAQQNAIRPGAAACAGAVVSPPGQCWLLCEYMCGGTLAAWLYGPGADPRCYTNAHAHTHVASSLGMHLLPQA